MNPRGRWIHILCVTGVLAALLQGCGDTPSPKPAATPSAATAQPTQPPSPSPTPVPTPTPTPFEALSIEAVADPSLAAADIVDPYAEINKYMAEIYQPDRELYNALYKAVLKREKSFDLTGYNLPVKKKADTAGCLYGETNYRLFYLKGIKVSKNGKKAAFTYSKEDPAAVQKNSVSLCARMSHLINDVMPEDYSDLQKLVSVFDSLCRMSDYAQKVDNEETQSPYSILMKGQGICWGYANIVQLLLSRAGLEVENVSNGAHAWDIVRINGNWYHTDVTWGAGVYLDSSNFLNTLLMDDQKRKEGLDKLGYGGTPVILGYPRDNPSSPPACTDRRFAAYNEIGCIWALDIEGGKVYFASPNGSVDAMNLDCTGRETLTAKMQPDQMAFFNGALYFTNILDGCLYKLIPGKEPVLLDGAGPIAYLKLEGTTLKYGRDATGVGCTELKLLPFDPKTAAGAKAFPASAIPAGRSFSFHIRFSAPADAAQNWLEHVYLTDAAGKTVPLHFSLSRDGRELTVRPKDCIESGALSLYVTGVSSAGGMKLKSACRLDVTAGSPE